MDLLVALPALNEEQSLADVIRRVPRTLDGVASVTVLVVDDGSSDRTAEIAAREGAALVRHAVTRGVGAAFHSAVEEALRRRVDLLVTVDADGQLDPGQIPLLLAPILRGEAGFVTGSRFARGRPAGMSRLRYWGNRRMVSLLGLLADVWLSDVSCGFRAYGRESLLRLNLFGTFTYTQEVILDLAFKRLNLAEVPVSVSYPPDRRSRVAASLWRYGSSALVIILRTALDHRPLLVFGTAGCVLLVAGLSLDGWLLGHWLLTKELSPYKIFGAAGVVLNLAGVLTVGLGLLGDVLCRLRSTQERILTLVRRHAAR